MYSDFLYGYMLAKENPDISLENLQLLWECKMQTCPICTTELHSNNTRTIGTKQICRECADSLNPLLDAIADGLTTRMENNLEEMSRNRFVYYEISENFDQLISNGKELMKVIESQGDF